MDDKWFVVSLLFKSVKLGQQSTSSELENVEQEQEEVYEEVHYLIKAQNQEDAELIGHSLGRKNEHFYKNIYGEQVLWRYEKLVECYEITDDLGDGAEIYSRHMIASKGTTTDEIVERYFPEG